MKKSLRNQKGFTLIEIIAVLVILGILAAVAIPKYLDLQTEAKAKAMDGAMAAAKGLLSIGFGKVALKTSAAPTATGIVTEVVSTQSMGDFGVTYTGSDGTPGTIAIDVSGTVGGMSGESKTATWVLPQ